ncbi:hypothetical protein MHIP_59640 [Mycolicibacterium hippocampi]|uniref:Uncharacterized protein n=1 Tax=Mycolicibacterium hippocampi TaxID=659824 RepID=A0A7I9ZWR4_9MYCO|nr:hypothetical protein MHIP_59640 [Mycolicibacterium hippocampi]
MAGGTDSAEKKDSWLTEVTLGQPERPEVLPGRGPVAGSLTAPRVFRDGGRGGDWRFWLVRFAQTARTPVACGPLGL